MDEYIMPLYTAEDEMNFKEYKSMCFALTMRTRFIVSIVISVMFVLVGIGYLAIKKELAGAIIFFGAAILYPLLVWYIYNSTVKKTYNSTKIAHDRRIFYSFFEDQMMVQTELGQNLVRYSDLYKIKETDDHFYLLVGRNQGYSLKKANCKEGLAEFIRKTK
ncbi:MAG: YcxB family protein [Clostridiales bacterium]|nr:YcxB family protein [Clostridiales bacterium]